MLQTLPEAPSPASAPSRPSSPDGRRSPSRLRVFFLRHFRACGEVRLAAERTGIARSTLYRWRDRDPRFRARWDSLAEQRQQAVEDRLMQLVREGEKTAVFYKGSQVGWRESHTARPAIALLACLDRREKRKEKRQSVSHSGDRPETENRAVSEGWREAEPRKTGSDEEHPIGASREDDAAETTPLRTARRATAGKRPPLHAGGAREVQRFGAWQRPDPSTPGRHSSAA